MLALPKEVRISNAVESISVPDSLVDPIRSAVMLKGRTLATAFATGLDAASFLSSAEARSDQRCGCGNCKCGHGAAE